MREDGTPYYIGKGRGYRAFYKHKQLVRQPSADRILFLKRNLTEEEAFKHEVYMIAVLGRKDLGTGILRNLTDGGEGNTGWKAPVEWREKARQRRLGAKWSEEIKRKIGEKHKNKIVSEKTKEKLRKNAFKVTGWFWITNDIEETMIAPDALMPESWRKGRKKKVR